MNSSIHYHSFLDTYDRLNLETDDESYEFNISLNSPMISPLCGTYSKYLSVKFYLLTDSTPSIIDMKSSQQTGRDNSDTSQYTETRSVNTVTMKVSKAYSYFHKIISYVLVVEPNVTNTKRPGRGTINKPTCSSKKPDEYDNEGETYSNM